ncbi:hypothetical protein CHLNCDRAFT_144806 [Chlorella variabilis]|uniref:Phytocyanin domain-containing protein n=1 Tax=Chlorella variabilis TaxID=554065 RepID=E1ZD19_CHLVA|nr:hypothetical protein CHLNCDRAFT_144808 [Chlorella variabilis]XP_005848442.1 hypothetical protein CHLNCDRAFT_144806 [Chlorella variabilis]EFN56144.1 hypothetical protein CHLNCDRAFT_144808 [Chlorella variabilis]EFN56340.1 hypothetical protein CHLNCDRAFT_144806 [Chlorella variabilis]|eukprot:XP_005848246.1 hypothetical protein CHLNCDRAFT_144808 [Chlorella variabilis]
MLSRSSSAAAAIALALLLVCCSGADAKTYSVEWQNSSPVIDGVPRKHITICKGDVLKVWWKNEEHSLWKMTGWGCDQTDYAINPLWPENSVDQATQYMTFSKTGTFYYSDQLADNCVDGLRLRVDVKTIKDCRPRPGSLTSRRAQHRG